MSWAEDNGYDMYDGDEIDQSPHFEYESGYWETKDGRRIPIRKMDTYHMLNCIKWLEKILAEYRDQIEHDSILEIEAKIEEFQDELQHRKKALLKGKGSF